MGRLDELKRLDKRTRNRLRAILSAKDDAAIGRLSRLRSSLTKSQSEALDAVLNGLRHERAVQPPTAFPKRPRFIDALQPHFDTDLAVLLRRIETSAAENERRLLQLAKAFATIDESFANNDDSACTKLIEEAIKDYGWSHALLRRLVLLRETRQDETENDKLENLLKQADLSSVIVSSLVHAYARETNILTIRRSIVNVPDRGALNRYSRTLAKLAVQPFANTTSEFREILGEARNCSLIDAVIVAKFNFHLFDIDVHPTLKVVAEQLGRVDLFDRLLGRYDAEDSEEEYRFYKQCTAWLEYLPVRSYRAIIDHFYDAAHEEIGAVHDKVLSTITEWIGSPSLSDLVKPLPFAAHPYKSLARLEVSGTVTRSAIFNYWLHTSEGQIGFEKDDLLRLMGKTRDLARTVPIKAARSAARLSTDRLVRLILLLLLAKRSKNELDGFYLRKLLEDTAFSLHGGSLVKLVKAYEISHPYVAEYIYDIATEDFLAKLNKVAPHRADIPEIRASLHEWMAEFKKDESYLQRARAVRIDHQLNRVRNEIDDYRIYVDPSRFISWLQDEMMIDVRNALTSTGTGKKSATISCDETLLSFVITQSYNTFCSNAIFGIASYIGRRIRHGTFHGHLYSSVINAIERNTKYESLFNAPQFKERWQAWKIKYNDMIEEIIRERLHVHSRTKPLGLLQPDVYGPHKQEIRSAAVKTIGAIYAETRSTEGLFEVIIDYCWRLAETDLLEVTKYLRAQQAPLKNVSFLQAEVIPSVRQSDAKLALGFQRELEISIDRKLSEMFSWFKRPTIVAPKASVSLLFDAIAAEVRDTVPDFKLTVEDEVCGGDELVGGWYHLVYDSLAIVVSNAARHGDLARPTVRRSRMVEDRGKRLVVEVTSAIKPADDPRVVASVIEQRKRADFSDANLYQGRSGISKLMLLAQQRSDFAVELYAVISDCVCVRLSYAMEH